jgi:hypothetical protein
MGAAVIDGLARKWLARLPHPFSPADRAAGYRYDISVLQAEFSLTQMPGRPVSGRVFFEQVIRDNLDIGRPDQIALVFGRRLMARKSRPTPHAPHPRHTRASGSRVNGPRSPSRPAARRQSMRGSFTPSRAPISPFCRRHGPRRQAPISAH